MCSHVADTQAAASLARWPQDATKEGDYRDERPTEHRSRPRRVGNGGRGRGGYELDRLTRARDDNSVNLKEDRAWASSETSKA
jgi:hypothetical protein